jgi:hypothetical protein
MELLVLLLVWSCVTHIQTQRSYATLSTLFIELPLSTLLAILGRFHMKLIPLFYVWLVISKVSLMGHTPKPLRRRPFQEDGFHLSFALRQLIAHITRMLP